MKNSHWDFWKGKSSEQFLLIDQALNKAPPWAIPRRLTHQALKSVEQFDQWTQGRLHNINLGANAP
jgi:hypothetical protein